MSESPEQVLANSRLNASLFGKAKLRFEGLLSKASEKLKADRCDDVSAISEALRSHSQTIRQTQVRIFWTLMEEPISFLAGAFDQTDFDAALQIQAHSLLSVEVVHLVLDRGDRVWLGHFDR